jgi:galactoside O-acetyltransferase
MAYISQSSLEEYGFKHLGKNVKISDKASVYDAHLISLSDNVRIDDFCVVSGNVTLGRNVHLAVSCNVAGGIPGIVFHDFAGLAYNVQVFAQSDDYSGNSLTNPTIPSQYKTEIFAPVEIGRHSIIGASAVVFPGVSIGQGCAIGALSLVVRSTDDWGIYAGNPARRVDTRSQVLLELEAQYLANE